MPDDRTLVTELATGLGMLGVAPPVLAGQPFLDAVPPTALRGVSQATWERLRTVAHRGAYHRELGLALANGKAFLEAPEALAGRVPRRVEWTAARRPLGDESIPADLRVDHVYLVSCKYLSQLLHNAAPARLFEGLLSDQAQDRTDWYLRSAPGEYQALYEACRHLVLGLPLRAEDLDADGRRRLAAGLKVGWPPEATHRYEALGAAVARSSAQRWAAAVGRGIGGERMLWRLLRVASAPYFVLGAQRHGSMRLRIDTPWDFHQRYELESFEVAALEGGQPQVAWSARCKDRVRSARVAVAGHVEIRWSHGRFRQPPEAKVYLDTPHHQVPGYHPLGEPDVMAGGDPQLQALKPEEIGPAGPGGGWS